MSAAAKSDPIPLADQLSELLIGQAHAIDAIVPFVETHQVGLSPAKRPIGVLLLLGPTGTGKTRTVEALAEVLHGSDYSLLRINCGEFQMDHEVSKLIGAPPGYLGHKETQPALTQAKVNVVASDRSDISLILFDEIEKAAPSMVRLLLGVLDKATLRLGDGNSVNFERCLIFMTSNLGAKEFHRLTYSDFGFPVEEKQAKASALNRVGNRAVKKKFPAEFVNRIDEIVSYNPLNREDCSHILDHILEEMNRLAVTRLGARNFYYHCTDAARDRLLDLGTSSEYGARHLKRTVQQRFARPVTSLLLRNEITPGAEVWLKLRSDEFVVEVTHEARS